MKVNNVLEVIGNTPLVKLNKIFGSDVEVWMKLERQNPGGSIKDRIALAMIETAEKEGKINKDTLDYRTYFGKHRCWFSNGLRLKVTN